jgi:hypothetical protein
VRIKSVKAHSAENSRSIIETEMVRFYSATPMQRKDMSEPQCLWAKNPWLVEKVRTEVKRRFNHA